MLTITGLGVPNEVTLPPLYASSLRRLQNAEKALRLTLDGLNTTHKATNGMPGFIVDAYNRAVNSIMPVMDRRLDEYASVGGDISARQELHVITTQEKASGIDGALMGIEDGYAVLRDATTKIPGWISNVAVVSAKRVGPGQVRMVAGSWEEAVGANQLVLAQMQASELGALGPFTVFVLILACALIAYKLLESSDIHAAERSKQMALDNEAAANEAKANIARMLDETFRSTRDKCVAAGGDPIQCVKEANIAAVALGKTFPVITTGTNDNGKKNTLSFTEKIGIAVIGTVVIVGGFYGYKFYRRTRGDARV